MFFVCTAIAVLSPVLLPVLARDWVPLLVLFFLWGGFAFGIYTLSMKELGDRFSGQALVTGNAAFAMAWSLGNLVGPAISGGMTAVAGLVSLPAFLGGAFAPVLVIAAIRTILRGRQRKQDAA
jgi:predicted MFS family arabinose efflux permease